MILLFIFVISVDAEILLPLHEKSESLTALPNSLDSFSFRGLLSPSLVTNSQNSQYYIKVSIGTPPQNFSLSLSLETSQIFIDQKKCSLCRKWTNKFDSALSATFKKTNNEMNTDTDGKIQGNTGKDTVRIGTLSADSQEVFLIYSESGMDNLLADGILGLGFSEGEAVSILKNLYDQNYIENMIFSLYLNDISSFYDLPDKGQSMLIIDGHDISKYAAENDFTYISTINNDKYWEMSLDEVNLDAATFTNGNKARITPGEKGILGPKDDIDGILQQLRSNSSCNIDSNNILICDCNANYPDLVFKIDGYDLKIKSAGYLKKLNKDCSPILGYSTISNTWILGNSFLRRFYTLYDMKNKKIGFATVGYISQISISGSSSKGSSNSSDVKWNLANPLIISALVVLSLWGCSVVILCIKLWFNRGYYKKEEESDVEIEISDSDR